MKLFIQNIKWDAILIYKYGIVYVALGITALYCLGFWFGNTQGSEKAIAALVFTDPAMYGFLFTSIMILFEKDANTHKVLAVTPMPTHYYILSKAMVFTSLSLVCSVAMILAATPQVLNLIMFVLGVVLSSVLFVFIGVITISYVNSFNQFVMSMPIVLAPVCLPFLDYFNLYNCVLFYIIPTQASLILFKASVSEVPWWQVIYAIFYLVACCFIAYKWAVKNYKKQILKTV